MKLATLEDVTAELELRNTEVTELNGKLAAAHLALEELRSTERELAVALAQDAPGAEDRLRALQTEIGVAAARATGLEQLVAAATPRLEELRGRWSTLKREEQRAQRAAEIERLTQEMLQLDAEIENLQVQCDRFVMRREETFQQRLALQHQQ